MAIRYISDLHMFHDNVTKHGKDFDGRPFKNLDEMHSYMIKAWNEVVDKNDTVYILGDLFWIVNQDNEEEVLGIINKLNGNKHFIKGNHDRWIGNKKIAKRFGSISEYKEIKDTLNNNPVKVVLSHYPILMWNGQHRGNIHLYGHVHNSIEHHIFQGALDGLKVIIKKNDGERYIPIKCANVGCMMEYMDYSPKTLDELEELGVL